jgi:hypothetical protein
MPIVPVAATGDNHFDLGHALFPTARASDTVPTLARSPPMSIANAHNLHQPLPTERPFGIRVTTRPGDPFRLLVGKDWGREHWYGTAHERDAALAEMRRRHEYSRAGDEPALEFDVLNR